MPQFIYFDLGNVLLYFDHRRAARQMAAVAGCSEQQVFDLAFNDEILRRIETGAMSSQEFYEYFCAETGTRPDYAALEEAGSDIFEVNPTILAVIGQLKAARYRMGILSNTSSSHWNFIVGGRYAFIRHSFETVLLSYEAGAMKPDPKIYQAAADAAGVAPQEIFFTDDRIENVEGARRAGFDAELFTGTLNLAKALRARGIRTNY